MSQAIPFLSPRMVGPRFVEHAIPLELLKDLSVLEEMIIETAKWCYLQDHPDRKRSPRGFSEGITLKLSGVEEGSAVPQLSLFVEDEALPLSAEGQTYFEIARDRFTGAINAAEHGGAITEHLPDALLGYFDRIGRGLREGEVIEFTPQEPQKATLNKLTRRRLVLASSQIQEMTEDVTLRGSIPEVDQGKMTFELQVINGPRLGASIPTQHVETVMEAFNGYKQGTRVLLQGVGRYNRYDRLQSLETVEHLSLLDANDVPARLEELKALHVGWLDGKRGLAPSNSGLDWLAKSFQLHYADELPLPYLYPTAEGGVQAEWTLGGAEISLEISLEKHLGEWHALQMTTEIEENETLCLDDRSAWQWLASEITKWVRGAA